MKRVLKYAKEEFSNAHTKKDTGSKFVFAIDEELLNHKSFSLMKAELEVKNLSSTYTQFLHYCSFIMLRDNPGRKFTSADTLSHLLAVIFYHG